MIHVILCVLLNYSVCCGNNPRVCFVDFVVVSLVSCMKMIVGVFVCLLQGLGCNHGHVK